VRTRVNNGFVQVDPGFAEMRGRLDATVAGLSHIPGLLNTLIGQQNDQ
jgi:hypothetical protein